MERFSTLLKSGVVAALLAATAALPASAQTIVKLAHSEAEGDLLKNPYWAFTEVFGRVIENETQGRYKVQVFPSATSLPWPVLTHDMEPLG